MEISIVVIKVLGIYFVVSGLFLILRGKTLPHLLKDLFAHPAATYLLGAAMVALSSYVLLVQGYVWDGAWGTVSTILLWMIFIKGVFYIFAPETLHKMVNQKMLGTFPAWGVVIVIIGIGMFFAV